MTDELILDLAASNEITSFLFEENVESPIRILVNPKRRQIRIFGEGKYYFIKASNQSIKEADYCIKSNNPKGLTELIKTLYDKDGRFWIQNKDCDPNDLNVSESYAHFSETLNSGDISETKYVTSLEEYSDLYEIKYNNGTYRYFELSSFEGYMSVSVGNKLFTEPRTYSYADLANKVFEELQIWHDSDNADNSNANKDLYWVFESSYESEFESIGIRYIVLNKLLKMNCDIDEFFNYYKEDPLEE